MTIASKSKIPRYEALMQQNVARSERGNAFLECDNAIAALRSLESVVSIPRGTKCMDHLPSHAANGGVELVTDRQEKTPAKAETAVLFEDLRELGILIRKGELHGNVFRIKPPMCFCKDDADFLVDALDCSVSKL